MSMILYVRQPYATFLKLGITEWLALPLNDFRPEDLAPGTEVRVHALPPGFSGQIHYGEEWTASTLIYGTPGPVLVNRKAGQEDPIPLDSGPLFDATVADTIDAERHSPWFVEPLNPGFLVRLEAIRPIMEEVTLTEKGFERMTLDPASGRAAYEQARQPVGDTILSSLRLPQEVTDPAVAEPFRGDILEGDAIRLELTVDGDVFTMVVIAAQDDRDNVFDSLPEGSLKVVRVERPEPKKVWPPS